MTEPQWKLWEPKPQKPRLRDRPKKLSPQQALAVELRKVIDAAMIYSDNRRNRKALDRLKLLLRRNPDVLNSSHVKHNLGQRRLDWIARVIGE